MRNRKLVELLSTFLLSVLLLSHAHAKEPVIEAPTVVGNEIRFPAGILFGNATYHATGEVACVVTIQARTCEVESGLYNVEFTTGSQKSFIVQVGDYCPTDVAAMWASLTSLERPDQIRLSRLNYQSSPSGEPHNLTESKQYQSNIKAPGFVFDPDDKFQFLQKSCDISKSVVGEKALDGNNRWVYASASALFEPDTEKFVAGRLLIGEDLTVESVGRRFAPGSSWRYNIRHQGYELLDDLRDGTGYTTAPIISLGAVQACAKLFGCTAELGK